MRIIGGELKGRNLLPPPAGSETRPITGSVKKSLFGMLEPLLDGAAVLDLYCGTGTLGIEAISRGAAWCLFAERDRRVVERLERNIRDAGVADRCAVRRGDVTRHLAGWLAELDREVDVAFVDPPYAHVREWSWADARDRIFAPIAGRLGGRGVVVLRCDESAGPPEQLGDLEVVRTRSYGDMRLALLARAMA